METSSCWGSGMMRDGHELICELNIGQMVSDGWFSLKAQSRVLFIYHNLQYQGMLRRQTRTI